MKSDAGISRVGKFRGETLGVILIDSVLLIWPSAIFQITFVFQTSLDFRTCINFGQVRVIRTVLERLKLSRTRIWAVDEEWSASPTLSYRTSFLSQRISLLSFKTTRHEIDSIFLILPQAQAQLTVWYFKCNQIIFGSRFVRAAGAYRARFQANRIILSPNLPN